MAIKFRVETSFDEMGEPVAAYIRVREGKVAQTKEVSEGVAFADFDAEGQLLGIELLAVCGADELASLLQQEPERVRHFLREGARQQLLVA